VSKRQPLSRLLLSTLVLLLSARGHAAAQDQPPGPTAPSATSEQGAPIATGTGRLVTSTVVELLDSVEEGEGKERRHFVAADRIRAGDEVYYTIRVQNPGRAPVRNVVVTKRLPFGMHYARGSAVGPGADVQFSVDGGDTFAPAAELMVRAGGRPPRRALVEHYTQFRWRLRAPLAPGATALLRFRATLS
jgi:uncharacterized repeat protein (TIGR01451 family)